jgi:RNA polymerase sigma-70 factor (ECF subfamily)
VEGLKKLKGFILYLLISLIFAISISFSHLLFSLPHAFSSYFSIIFQKSLEVDKKMVFLCSSVENKQPINIRLKEGDPGAYEELFKQSFARLLGYCKLFVHDQSQANDLVQECFIKLWEKHATINVNQSVESLLFVMLRNRCLNHLRDQKIHSSEKSLYSLDESELQHLFQLDFLGREEITLEEELIVAMRESVERLPEKRKIVFVKAKIEGKKNKDIADELDISVKAVEKHLHQAKDQIRQELLSKFPLLAVLIFMILE